MRHWGGFSSGRPLDIRGGVRYNSLMENFQIGDLITAEAKNDYEVTGRIAAISYEGGYITFTVVAADGMESTLGTGGHLGNTFVNDYGHETFVTRRR